MHCQRTPPPSRAGAWIDFWVLFSIGFENLVLDTFQIGPDNPHSTSLASSVENCAVEWWVVLICAVHILCTPLNIGLSDQNIRWPKCFRLEEISLFISSLCVALKCISINMGCMSKYHNLFRDYSELWLLNKFKSQHLLWELFTMHTLLIFKKVSPLLLKCCFEVSWGTMYLLSLIYTIQTRPFFLSHAVIKVYLLINLLTNLHVSCILNGLSWE